MKMNQRTWNTTELAMNTIMPSNMIVSMNLTCHSYTYRGLPLIKTPFDFALYHLLLWNLKPKTIIEIGSFAGGSALWMGDILNTYEHLRYRWPCLLSGHQSCYLDSASTGNVHEWKLSTTGINFPSLTVAVATPALASN